MTGNGVISSTLDVECREICAESVWRILGEQVTRDFVGKERIALLYVVGEQSQHQHVRSLVGRFVQQVRTEELLFANVEASRISETSSSSYSKRTRLCRFSHA